MVYQNHCECGVLIVQIPGASPRDAGLVGPRLGDWHFSQTVSLWAIFGDILVWRCGGKIVQWLGAQTSKDDSSDLCDLE